MLAIIKQFVRRMLMGKGKGILQVPPQKAVDDFAKDLYKKFKENGIPDGAVNNTNDVKAIWNQITNREAQILSNNLTDTFSKLDAPLTSKKAGEVVDLTGKKIKPDETIIGGKGYKIETEAEKKLELDKLLGPGDDVFGSPMKDWFMKKFKKPPKAKDVTPKETEAQIKAKIEKQNKEAIERLKKKMDDIKKIEDPEDLAGGGIAGMLGEPNASGGRVPMLWGGGIYKTIIKVLAKLRGVDPSEYLKIANYKSLPNNVKKIISKAEFAEMKTNRIAMFENLVEMAKSKKSYEKSIKDLSEEFSKKGLKGDEYVDMMFKDQFKSPVPHGVTDEQILQGEQLLKNLKTEGRPLNATGGRVPLAGGAIVKGGNWIIKSLLNTRQQIKTLRLSPDQLKQYLD